MFGFVKMAAVSAVLSYGVVTAYGPTPAAGEAGPAKPYQDRAVLAAGAPAVRTAALTTGSGAAERVSPAGKGDRLAPKPECADQTWPYISAACARRADGAVQPKAVRVITMESRVGANTSALARMPQAGTIQR
ncbi:MAG TPA: hypothetical protein VHL98_19995 [Microvirga sp.]|jgi:hypothetical protein|nr:hypothetical protein [Microvirga sp.]